MGCRIFNLELQVDRGERADVSKSILLLLYQIFNWIFKTHDVEFFILKKTML